MILLSPLPFNAGAPGFFLDDALRGWLCQTHRDIFQLLQVGREFSLGPIWFELAFHSGPWNLEEEGAGGEDDCPDNPTLA